MADITIKELVVVVTVTGLICWWIATYWAYGGAISMIWIVMLLIWASHQEGKEGVYN